MRRRQFGPGQVEHDVGKWDQLFGKDHAESKAWGGDPIRSNRMARQRRAR
jgi:hypothetical protein